MTWVRPGPTSIPPGAVPGGVVIHCYAVPTQRLLAVSFLHSYAEAEAGAARAAGEAIAAMRSNETEMCLVAFDGDTGERMVWRP